MSEQWGCDWGDCDGDAVGVRYDRDGHGWLPVCRDHFDEAPEPERALTWQSYGTTGRSPRIIELPPVDAVTGRCTGCGGRVTREGRCACRPEDFLAILASTPEPGIDAHLTSLHRAARTLRSECGVCRDITLAAAPPTPEPDADGFMMMHNAGRHDVACKWSRPGIIDASVDPCTCGLAEDIAAILASTPEPGIDFAPPLPELGCECGACRYLRRKQAEALAARLASEKEQT